MDSGTSIKLYTKKVDTNSSSSFWGELLACAENAVNYEQGNVTVARTDDNVYELRDQGNVKQFIKAHATTKTTATPSQKKKGGGGGSGSSSVPTEEKVVESFDGYVEKAVFDAMNVSSVSIPQNFHALENVCIPTQLEYQLFRIVDIEESDNEVTITARHVWYDNLQNYTLWQPTAETSYSAGAVCRNIMTNAVSPTSSHVATDCTDTMKGGYFDYERKNIVECFLDPEEGICAKFDLFMLRYNWDFYCLKNVGYDRGMVIQDKKNLLGIERTESIEDVVTRVVAYGKDENGNIVWLNNSGKKYVDSTHINDYGFPRCEVYDTGVQVGKDNVTAANLNSKILAKAQERFSVDHADLPEVSLTVDFVSLGDTEEYSQYRGLDRVFLYDIVSIKDTERDYSYQAQVVGIEYDILTGMLNSITIGDIRNWDGKRKIAAWQVPEISGALIRERSIREGSFVTAAIRTGDIKDGAVDSDKIKDGAVNSGHMSQSADSHFKTIFAEELYISNTSEDGLLNTRFTVNEQGISGLVEKTGVNNVPAGTTIYGKLSVEAGKVAMVVGTNQSGNYIKAAEICTSINEAGEGVATIDANHVYIGNSKSTTIINGKLNASDVTADYLAAKIATIPTLSGIVGHFSGNLVSDSSVIAPYVYLGTGGAELGGGVSAVRIDGPSNDTYKLQYQTYRGSGWTDAGSFSRATSLSGSWSGTTYTVTASPQGNTTSTTIVLELSGSANIIGAKVRSGNTDITSAGAQLEEDTTNKKVTCSMTGGSQSTIAQISTQNTWQAGWNTGNSAGQTTGWTNAYNKVSWPGAGTGSSITVKAPSASSSTTGGQQSTTYTLSTDGTYAYIKTGAVTVARVSNTGVTISSVTAPAGTSTSATVTATASNGNTGTCTVSVDNTAIGSNGGCYAQAKIGSTVIARKWISMPSSATWSSYWPSTNVISVTCQVGGTSYTHSFSR